MEMIDRETALRKWFLEQDISVEDLKQDTVGGLIWQARNDERTLWRAGRNVYRTLLPDDGSESQPLCETGDPILKRLYHDQPESMEHIPLFNDFYFLGPTCARLLNHYRAVKDGREEERMILWVWGPSGVGKSDMMEAIALRLEDLTYPAREGCSFHGHPLYAVPRERREMLYRSFYFFKGNLCGACQDRLRKDCGNRWWDFPVERIPYSLNAAHGIAFIEQPLVSKKGGEYPDQWYNIVQKDASGGVLILGCAKEPQPPEFLSLLAEVVNRGSMNAKANAERVDIDFAIIVVSNSSPRSYRPGDHPFYRRVVELPVPAVVSPAAEERIHAKLSRFATPSFHFMPHAERALNIVVCASRIRDSGSPDPDKLMERLFLYDGMLVLGDKKTSPLPKTESFRTLLGRNPRDGMDESLSLGAAIKIRASVGERSHNGCVTISDMMVAARNQITLESLSGDPATFPKKLLGDEETDAEKDEGKVKIGPLERWYQWYIEMDLAAAWIGYDLFWETMRTECDRYLAHASAYVNSRKFVDEKEEEAFDEGVLKKVEEQVGVIGSSEPDTFRRQLIGLLFSGEQRGTNMGMSYESSPVFRMALLKKIIYGTDKNHGLLHELCIAFDLAPTDKPRDPEKERVRREALAKNLTHEKLGYRPCCVAKLLGEGPGTGYLRQRLYAQKKS